MAFTYFATSWLFSSDFILELLFAVIALVIAIFARKIYKVTDQRPLKFMSLAFFCISISYFIQSLFNFLLIMEIRANNSLAAKVKYLILFHSTGIYAYMLFMTIGLSFLVYMTFKTERQRILWLLIATSVTILLFTSDALRIFFILSSIYLVFITWHFVENYIKNPTVKTLLIALAFVFLLIGNVHFIFSMNHSLFYVMGHLLELAAYILIAVNLYMVLKK